MNFRKPVVVYTAASNVDAHLIVEMLEANGVPAHAIEDQSGPSLWMFGTLYQFHKPTVWVEESTVKEAAKVIEAFEQQRRARNCPSRGVGKIEVVCEECGRTTVFRDALNGTTQECSYCHAYVDVGELPWDDDVGERDT